MKTKFTSPVPRSGLVSRPGLWSELDSDALPKLTLVAAPAGFGKTTFLIQWRDALRHHGVVTSWLSMQSGDDSGVALLRDIVHTTQLTIPSLTTRTPRLVDGTSNIDLSRTLTSLINELEEVSEPFVLFLDDYHSVGNGETDELLELLLNLSPRNFHMVVAARTRPSIALAALRVRDELWEITARELRFSLPEAAEFFTEVRGLSLTREQVSRIHAHSEGWIAGLQLASLALRDPQRREQFIESFSGRLQDIAEYLASDVLNQQTKEVQDFLLRTSVVPRIHGDLALRLSGTSRSAELLANIEAEGLFAVPLDEERTWYRYHPLFQEFLLTELQRRYPDDVLRLYSVASDWFESHQLAREALECATSARDIPRVIGLVEQQAWMELMAGRMPRVIAWIRRIPDDVRNANWNLLYLLGTALYHTNSADEAENVLELLEKCPLNGGGDQDTTQCCIERIRILKAGVAIARDDPGQILEPLNSDFSYVSDFELGIVKNIRGYALAEFGRFDVATKSLVEARHHHRVAQSEFGIVYSDCFLAMTDYGKGNFEHALARFGREENGLVSSSEKYVAPVPQVVQGVVFYQWNQLDEALDRLQSNLPLISEVGHIKLLALGHMALARICGFSGDHRTAMRLYDEILSVGAYRGTPFQRLRSLVEGDRIGYLLQSGRLNEAIDHALASDIDVDAPTVELPTKWERVACLDALTWSRMQIATGRAELTLGMLPELRSLATDARRERRAIECMLLEISARTECGLAGIENLLAEAINRAAQNNAIRCFLDEGSAVTTHIRSFAGDQALTSRRARELLATLKTATRPEQADSPATSEQTFRLIEPISDREQEILHAMAAGSTNSVIATSLNISENTVKWHLKNLFGKLGVRNRASAVAVAQQLGLL